MLAFFHFHLLIESIFNLFLPSLSFLIIMFLLVKSLTLINRLVQHNIDKSLLQINCYSWE